MEAMGEAWTDDRLDHLNRRVDDGFTEVDRRFEQIDKRLDGFEAQVDQRFNGFEAQVNQRFDELKAVGDWRFDKVATELHRINDRLDAFHRTTYYFLGGMFVVLLGAIIQPL